MKTLADITCKQHNWAVLNLFFLPKNNFQTSNEKFKGQKYLCPGFRDISHAQAKSLGVTASTLVQPHHLPSGPMQLLPLVSGPPHSLFPSLTVPPTATRGHLWALRSHHVLPLLRPSMAPTSLKAKAKPLATVHMALHTLPCRLLVLTTSRCSPPSLYPATMAS